MGPDENEAAEAVNREQQDEGQAQDVARDALERPESLGESSRAPGDGMQILPDDTPDLVDKLNEMVSSGRIDNGAFAGEPMHDDEEHLLGDTEDDGTDPLEGLHELPDATGSLTGYAEADGGFGADDELFNELADGSEDPLADLPDLTPTALEDVPDTGADPLADVASESGDEWGRHPRTLDDEAGARDTPA